MCERQPPFSVNSGKGKPFQEKHSDQTYVMASPRKRAPPINYGEGSGPVRRAAFIFISQERDKVKTDSKPGV